MPCPSRTNPRAGATPSSGRLTIGPFAAPHTELTVAYILGVLLIGSPGWQLLAECTASPRALLFVSPSARLARVPWGLLALPKSGPTAEELVRARADAITAIRPGGRPNPLAARRYQRPHRRLSADGVGRRVDGGTAEHRALAANTGRMGRQARRSAAAGPRPSGAGTAPGLRARVGARQAVGADASGAALRRADATPPGTAERRCGGRAVPPSGCRPQVAGRAAGPAAESGSSTSDTRARQTATPITQAAPTGPRFTSPVRRGFPEMPTPSATIVRSPRRT